MAQEFQNPNWLNLREGSSDWAIWLNVVENNEYKLPERMTNWTVVDIGAHIGSFVYASLSRGAGKVYAIEPDPENFKLLTGHVMKMAEFFGSSVELFDGAINEYDESYVTLSRYPIIGNKEENTGGASIYLQSIGKGIQVKAVFPDRIIKESTIDLLKMDCEGCEWKMIRDYSSIIARSRIVCGEFHERQGPFTTDEWDRSITTMERYFDKLGYSFNYERHGATKLGLFWAHRR